jgi:DNA-binding NarL/FixJ family response regulator
MTKTRIVVADDHGIVRKGLRFILERQEDMEVAGEAADGREVVRVAEELQPHVIVMDIAMPHLNGIDASTQILRHNPERAASEWHRQSARESIRIRLLSVTNASKSL